MCDEKCDKYGDCCLNSQYFNAAQQRRAVSSFKCTAIENNEHVYTKVDCPPLWRNAEVRRKCEKSAAYNVDDPLLMTPVTSFETNATYGNIFCAACNRDSDRLAYWQLNLDCRSVADGEKLPSGYDREYVEKNLSFDNKMNYWQVRADDGAYYKCDLILSIAQSAKQLVRRCRPTIKTCPATWGKDEIRQRCESYTLMVHKNSTSASSKSESFRNIHCAICNSVPVQSVGCESSAGDSLSDVLFKFESFTILFDFNGGRLVGGEAVNCSGDGGRVYDRFFRRCRNVAAAPATKESGDGDADVNGDGYPVEIDERDRTLRETPLNCSEVIFFDELTNDTGTLEAGKSKYAYANREQRRNALEICREYYEAAAADGRSKSVNTYRPYYSVITALGIGVSVICLCVHLIVFAVVKELRNLSGKNLASFCVALLLAYVSFGLGDALDGKLCAANAVCTYYLFTAAFTWMLVMSFDVWRTLRIATKELRVSSGKQWRKFMVYSFCSWVLPAKLALTAVLVDLCPIRLVADRFRPRFGVRSCWFGQGPAMLAFFGFPVLLVLVCNAGFFLSSAYMIYSSHSMTRYSASPATKRDFRLYARLAVLMGMTWISGLLAALTDSEILWVVFILSNASLGLFVFLAFTCRSKVLRALKNLKRDSVLNLPAAFSWSMNASEADAKSHHVRSSSSSADSVSEKPTSNTYY